MRTKLIAALLVAVLVVMAGPGVASANIADAVNQLHAQGLESSAEVNQTYVNLSNTSNGTVSSVTYNGANQIRTDNSFTVASQTYDEAHDKIAQFVLDLNIKYNPDTSLGISGLSNNVTVSIYTYGTMKDQVAYAIVSGLVDCLGNPPIIVGSGGSGSSSWVNNYTPDAMAPQNITTFKIGDPVYTVNGTTQTMDVAPVLNDGRTYVPVRFLAYSLGVPVSGVQWNEQTQQVTISKGTTTIGLTIGSPTMTINDIVTTMDVAPYVLDGRTMLPARWVAEPLGATVTWDETTQQVMLGVPQTP